MNLRGEFFQAIRPVLWSLWRAFSTRAQQFKFLLNLFELILIVINRFFDFCLRTSSPNGILFDEKFRKVSLREVNERSEPESWIREVNEKCARSLELPNSVSHFFERFYDGASSGHFGSLLTSINYNCEFLPCSSAFSGSVRSASQWVQRAASSSNCLLVNWASWVEHFS